MAEPCSVDGCPGFTKVPGTARGWCHKHYRAWKLYGDPLASKLGRKTCSIDGCEKFVEGRGWCSMHYSRFIRKGDPLARNRGEVVEGKRICPGCRRDLPLDSYTEGKSGRCKACRAEEARSRRAVNPPPLVPKHPSVCDCCGETFPADGRRWRYCSRECFQAFKNRANWKHLNARRARLRAVLVEVFTREEIFERDGWVCRICNTAVDRAATWPDPAMPSLDHIIPVSRGGQHSRANAQTAHLGCNVRKGASLPVAS